MSRGGKRKGAGAPLKTPTGTHPVRCTDEGWTWLQAQASGKGHTSVGKWADSAGRKAPKRKGNVMDEGRRTQKIETTTDAL